MSTIMEQMPIVFHALNVGFLQTLKLFFVTLLGAFPLGLIISFGSLSGFRPLRYLTKLIVWIIRGTPLMIQLLIIYYFPGLVLGKTIWSGGEEGRFMAAAVSFIINYSCYFSMKINSRKSHKAEIIFPDLNICLVNMSVTGKG